MRGVANLQKHCKYDYKTYHEEDVEDHRGTHPEVRLTFICPFCKLYTDIDVLYYEGKYIESYFTQKCKHTSYVYDDCCTVVFDDGHDEDGEMVESNV